MSLQKNIIDEYTYSKLTSTAFKRKQEDDQCLMNILIAEDDEDDYLLTMDAIESLGIEFNHTWVRDGVEVLEFLDEQKPDVILLDINMPRKNGLEALEEIRQNKEFEDILIIVLSSSVDHEGILNTYQFGIDSFIQKTSDLNNFIDFFKILFQYWFQLVKLQS